MKTKRNLHTRKVVEVCGCHNCDNYVVKGIGALNLLRCEHCKEKHGLKRKGNQ